MAGAAHVGRPPGGRAGGLARALALAVAASSAPAALALPYGVNAHIPSPGALDAAAAAGVQWVRVDFLWSLVEPGPGVFDWSAYDALADQAVARGLKVYATISDTPAWATDGPAGTGVPRRSADFYDLCFRAASRYRGRIDYWGMWNEPNDPQFWAGSRDQYIDGILRNGAQAVHAASPGARACGPELAHLQSDDWDKWLRDVLRRASDVLDVVTHHVYPSGSSAASVIRSLDRSSPYPWDPPCVRKVLQDNGWAGRPFWLTETGCVSGGDAAGEAAQAAFVSDLLGGLFGPQRSVSWVGKAFLYELSDDPRFPDSYGLLGPGPAFAVKPAYQALQQTAASLAVDDAEIVRVEMPRWLPPSAAASGSVEVRNTGTTTWSADAGYRLAAGGDEDPLASIRHDLAPGESVAPGQSYTFTLELTAPAEETLAGQPLVSDWQMVREYAWRFGEIATARVDVSATAPGRTTYLPFAAGLVDTAGRVWSSDLELRNRASIALSAHISLLLPGAGAEPARGATVTVAGGGGLSLADVVRAQLGAEGLGVLRVDADSGDLLAGATLAVAGPRGRYAAFTRGLAADGGIGGGAEGRLLRLVRTASGTVQRTGLLLLNPGAEATGASVELLDDAGASLGRLSYALPPLGVLYVDDVLGEVGAGEVGHGQALVRPDPGGASVLAWALVSDLRSGDPTIVAPAAPGSGPLLLAPVEGAARLRGGAWNSELQLVAPPGGAGDVTLSLLTTSSVAAPAARTLAVPEGGGVVLSDLPASLFGFRGTAALLVTPRSGAVFAAAGNTVTRVPAPYGQAIEPVPVAQATGEGAGCLLFPLTRGAAANGARTHLGLVNPGMRSMMVSATFFGPAGKELLRLWIPLDGGEWRQVPDVLQPTGIDGQSCWALMQTSTPGARFIASATVVQGGTGDPMPVPCV